MNMDFTDVLTSLRRIIRTVNLESKRIEKEYGISIPQLLCLHFLRKQKKYQASHKQLKDQLSLNASTITGIISRLEKKGLVAKLPRFGDRRVSLVTLTAKGEDMLNNSPQPMHLKLSRKLEKLSPDELDKLQQAFVLISNFLEADDLDASPILTSETTLNSSFDS
jgi:DNA-binding MarR family transcriptional regulator